MPRQEKRTAAGIFDHKIRMTQHATTPFDHRAETMNRMVDLA